MYIYFILVVVILSCVYLVYLSNINFVRYLRSSTTHWTHKSKAFLEGWMSTHQFSMSFLRDKNQLLYLIFTSSTSRSYLFLHFVITWIGISYKFKLTIIYVRCDFYVLLIVEETVNSFNTSDIQILTFYLWLNIKIRYISELCNHKAVVPKFAFWSIIQ